MGFVIWGILIFGRIIIVLGECCFNEEGDSVS